MTRTSAIVTPLQSALQQLPGGSLAGKRHEDWRYTSLEPAIDIGTRWLADGSKSSSNESLQASIEAITTSIDANWLVIANGVIDDSTFPTAAGIEIERYRVSRTNELDRPLAKLGAALGQDGLRINVKSAMKTPLGLLLIDHANQAASVSQATIEISIDPDCHAEIIEYQASDGSGDHYGNSDISMHLAQAATVHYARLQNRGIKHVQTGHLSIDMGRDSTLELASYDLGGGLIRNDVVVDIAAPGANVHVVGLYLASSGQHIDNHTRVDHRVGPATSSQEYRGILNGSCRAVWNGKAIVHEGADGTDANQENHNLLLSTKAEIDAKPELEIYADDVKCSHGTTVGQLDDAALYYLRTRGIDKSQATQLLTHAFAADLIHRVSVGACREAVAALVEARLSDMITEDAP